MSDRSNRLRLHRSDRVRLKELKEHESVREMVGSEDKPTYDELFELILPEDVVFERSEEDMVWVSIRDELHQKTNETAGENVSVHETVNRIIDEFVEQYDIELENEQEYIKKHD